MLPFAGTGLKASNKQAIPKPKFEEIARVNALNKVENFLQNGDQIVSINGESSIPKIIYWTRYPQTIPDETVTVNIYGKQDLKMTKQLFIEKLMKANVQVRSRIS
ncbi:hypothetical protein BAG01nite_19340 [Brevibacillus agri]|uniref:PDZ domain-containing protein n=1 Tax=Brevibacillus agri TaxID=51101 RepID=A0A3M8AUU6_9BACL|nr:MULTISPECIES: hypothetical protein [Brevibacillus]ELK41866.1 hypothetical protein D478_11352 [Brevibacillus agri BAB-2500]MBG9566872.1 hypothetical protein [Brevibacillus agri]MDR9505582.1 hypothetical protein [Brevibacillus agri]MED3499701.1 hypothetical protein [Brevibacillus agri]MED4570331.1 hypothetical protein [Brevibacillus agri]